MRSTRAKATKQRQAVRRSKPLQAIRERLGEDDDSQIVYFANPSIRLGGTLLSVGCALGALLVTLYFVDWAQKSSEPIAMACSLVAALATAACVYGCVASLTAGVRLTPEHVHLRGLFATTVVPLSQIALVGKKKWTTDEGHDEFYYVLRDAQGTELGRISHLTDDFHALARKTAKLSGAPLRMED